MLEFLKSKNQKEVTTNTVIVENEKDVSSEVLQLKLINNLILAFTKLEYDVNKIQLNNKRVFLHKIIADYSGLAEAYFENNTENFISFLQNRLTASLKIMTNDTKLFDLLDSFSSTLKQFEKIISVEYIDNTIDSNAGNNSNINNINEFEEEEFLSEFEISTDTLNSTSIDNKPESQENINHLYGEVNPEKDLSEENKNSLSSTNESNSEDELLQDQSKNTKKPQSRKKPVKNTTKK